MVFKLFCSLILSRFVGLSFAQNKDEDGVAKNQQQEAIKEVEDNLKQQIYFKRIQRN